MHLGGLGCKCEEDAIGVFGNLQIRGEKSKMQTNRDRAEMEAPEVRYDTLKDFKEKRDYAQIPLS